MPAASQAQINSLAKQFGLTPEAAAGQIKGASYDYGMKVLKNNAAKSSGVSTGSSADAGITAAKDYSTGLNNLVTGQNARQDVLFNKFTELSGGQEKLSDAYTRMQTEAGVPELNAQLQTYKDQIYKTKNLLDQLDENVKTRTSGTFTNQAQVNRQIAAEGTPLNTTLARLGTAEAPILDRLTSASNNISTQLGFMQADQAKELDPIKLQINTLSDRFSRELTGYTQGKQAELTAITDKIKRDQQLTDQEWTRANQLADAETEWDQKKQALQIQFENDVKLKQTRGAGTGDAKSDTLKITNGSMTAKKDNSGYNFTNKDDQSVTPVQFAQNNNTDIATLLGNSPYSTDQELLKDISAGLTDQQLYAKYPWLTQVNPWKP